LCNDVFVGDEGFAVSLYRRLYPEDPEGPVYAALFVGVVEKLCPFILDVKPDTLFDNFSQMERPKSTIASPMANTWGSGSAIRGSGTPGCPFPIGNAKEGISEPGIG